jgi:hypothetical protein
MRLVCQRNRLVSQLYLHRAYRNLITCSAMKSIPAHHAPETKSLRWTKEREPSQNVICMHACMHRVSLKIYATQPQQRQPESGQNSMSNIKSRASRMYPSASTSPPHKNTWMTAFLLDTLFWQPSTTHSLNGFVRAGPCFSLPLALFLMCRFIMHSPQ